MLVRAGGLALRARLLRTPAADTLWAMLPVYSVAEVWSRHLQFELPATVAGEVRRRHSLSRAPLPAGRFALTACASRCSVGWGADLSAQVVPPIETGAAWAVALDDPLQLAAVRAGERIAMLVGES